ncbi:MAG: hypothetical protein RPR40_13750 [Bermanella sp.]
MSTEIIQRSELPSDYSDMMETESHHEHAVIKDSDGIIRWQADPFIDRFVDACSLNCIVRGFHENGTSKNSEVYRELYRKMGYSLSGYWEIFYWDTNNDDADEYRPPNREGE